MKVIIPYQDGTNFVVNRSIAQDNKGNIWITGWSKGVFVIDSNFDVSQPVTDYPNLTYTKEFEENVDYVWKVFADSDGWIWLGTYKNGLIIINPGQNVFSKNDDIIKRISMNEGLLGYYIESINQDKDGYLWIGTEGGLNRIEKLQNGSFKVDKMNNLLGVDTIEVNGIDIDRLNNKWIGTSAGIAKISSENDLKAFYTKSNSGLISDYILSLKYDNDNDILWIGTDSGVEKFKAVSKPSASTNKNHIYPNPFELWGMSSTVNFAGLKAGKPVKIYNFSGDLVNEIMPSVTDENGEGRAVWNGRNFKDEFVGSGVYFISGTDNSGNEFRDKMVVVRR
jgi:ligand-binding sensor domain-containing protein